MNRIAEAVIMVENLFPDSFYTFSKGRLSRMEPLYAFQVVAVKDGLSDLELHPITVESDDPVDCVIQMVRKCSTTPEAST